MSADPTYHFNLGLTLRRLGRVEEACEALLRAVALKPDLVDASFNLGLAMVELGDSDSATQCFERVADLKPDLFANQQQLARVLAARGAVKRAVGHYHCALVLNPRSVEVMLELADALRKLGRKPAAAALTERARAISEGA